MPYYTNAKQHIPPLFKEIMRNHADVVRVRAAIRTTSVVSWNTALSLRALHNEMREYRRAAEIALRWNTNKGSTM